MAPFSPFPRAHPRGRNCGGSPKIQVVYCSPSYSPWTRPATHPGGAWVQLIVLYMPEMISMNYPCCSSIRWGARFEQGRPGKERPSTALVLFFTRLFASTLASESSLYTLLLAGLQVKGVALDLLDNVFLLHLALKTAQRVLEGFTLLKPYFCQTDTPPNPSGWTE